MRHPFQAIYQDGRGRVVKDGSVTVYLAGTTTLAIIYSTSISAAISGSVVTTGNIGQYNFWVDDADHASNMQLFDIQLSKTGFVTQKYSDIPIIRTLVKEFYPETYGAKADNSTDCYEAFKAMAVAVTANGGGVIRLSPGTYKIDRVKTQSAFYFDNDPLITNNDCFYNGCKGLQITGYGSKLDLKGNVALYGENVSGAAVWRNYSVIKMITPFRIQNSSQIMIEGVEIDGNFDQITNILYNWPDAGGGNGAANNVPILYEAGGHPIYFEGCRNVTVLNAKIHHAWSDNIAQRKYAYPFLPFNATSIACKNIVLDNCEVYGAARANISGFEIRNFSVRNSNVYDGGRPGNTPIGGTGNEGLNDLFFSPGCNFAVEPDADGTGGASGQKVWATGVVKLLNDTVFPTGVATNFYYFCTTPGTTHAVTEPTWPVTAGLTVNDNGVIWTCSAVVLPVAARVDINKNATVDTATLAGIKTWATGVAKIANDAVIPVAPKGYYYICTVGGTTGGSEPTWPTYDGRTIIDNGITWICKKLDIYGNSGFISLENSSFKGSRLRNAYSNVRQSHVAWRHCEFDNAGNDQQPLIMSCPHGIVEGCKIDTKDGRMDVSISGALPGRNIVHISKNEIHARNGHGLFVLGALDTIDSMNSGNHPRIAKCIISGNDFINDSVVALGAGTRFPNISTGGDIAGTFGGAIDIIFQDNYVFIPKEAYRLASGDHTVALVDANLAENNVYETNKSDGNAGGGSYFSVEYAPSSVKKRPIYHSIIRNERFITPSSYLVGSHPDYIAGETSTTRAFRPGPDSAYNTDYPYGLGEFSNHQTETTTIKTLTYGTTVNTDASLGSVFVLTASNTTEFTIANPTNPVKGQMIEYIIKNTSGGVLCSGGGGGSAILWGNLFKNSVTNYDPTNGNSRSYNFLYDGTNWRMASVGVLVPN